MESHSPEVEEDPYLDSERLESLLDTLEKKSHQLEESASRLSANYVIFDSIMCIPSVMASSPSLERSRWILLCISASVSISFWLMIITTLVDGMRIRFQWDLVLMAKARLRRKIYYMQNGEAQDATAVAAAVERGLAKPLAVARYKRYAYVGLVLTGLFAFTVLVLFAISSNP